MRITEHTDRTLVLSGIPGTRGAMIASIAIGALMSVVFIWMLVVAIGSGRAVDAAWLGLGVLVAQAVFWVGAITLAVGRERLEIDLGGGQGRYTVRSPIVEVDATPFAFSLEDVDSVSIELDLEHTRGYSSSGMRRASERESYRARLRVREPRRAVTLIEGGVGDVERVRALAAEIGSALGVGVVDATLEGEPERAEPEAVGVPIVRRADLDAIEIPDQPEPAEWDLDINPEALRLTLTRMKRGGAPVVGCFLVILTFIGVIGLLMGVAAWLPGQTFNGRPISPGVSALLSIPGGVMLVVVPWSWVSLVRGRRVVEIDPRSVRASWVYPGRGAVGRISLLARVLARGQRVATPEVDSVRSIKGANGRVVEVRAGDGFVRIGSDADDEDAERASLVWVGEVVRAGVRAMGARA